MQKKLEQRLFEIAVVLETLLVLLDKSNYIIQHETWDFRIIFGIFAVKIAITRYNKKEWVGIISLIGLGILSWWITDREEIVRIVALVVAAKNVDMKRTLRIVMWETVAGCGLIMGLSIIGIYGDVAIEEIYRGGGIPETRVVLGMGHPNALHCMLLMCMLLLIVNYEKYIKWYGYVVLLVANIGIYKLTDSRTGLLISTAMVTFAIIAHYGNRFRESKLFLVVVWTIVAAEILLTIIAGTLSVGEHKLLWDIDMHLNGRMDHVYKEGGIQAWKLFSAVGHTNYFDMGIARGFYWYGVIPMIIFFVALAFCIYECQKEKEYGYIILLVSILMYSLMEAHAISVFIGRNYSFLVMGAMLPKLFKEQNEFSCIDMMKKVLRKA